jgi:hypothetical protein
MKKLYILIILVLALIVVMLSRSIFFGEKNFDIKNQLKAENETQLKRNLELKEKK